MELGPGSLKGRSSYRAIFVSMQGRHDSVVGADSAAGRRERNEKLQTCMMNEMQDLMQMRI
jgi:hypothetical protein